MAKRTYVLPDDTATKFEQIVLAGERSKIVATLIQDWMAEKRRQELREAVIEGCREMTEVYRDMAAEWNPVDEEAWRAH